MPTNTPISSINVTTATASVTFAGIPQTYTDLYIVCNPGSSATVNDLRMQFNGDTSALYSETYLRGSGSAATSVRETGQTSMGMGWMQDTIVSSHQINILNYANTATYKSAVCKFGSASGSNYVGAVSGLYRSNNAVTSITLLAGSGTISAGSTFSLYGISTSGVSATGNVSTKAIGGTVVYSGSYTYHVFTSSGLFTSAAPLTADVLVVAGGGAGGVSYGAGGGGGGVVYFASQSLPIATSYSCIVGAGGITPGNIATNGNNSRFGTLTAAVGGGGGGWSPSYARAGWSGGSGGGSSIGGTPGSSTQTGTGATAFYGNAGGTSVATYTSGGGGGAGSAGGNGGGAGSPIGGDGGYGTGVYSSWGSATSTGVLYSGTYYYAGGGAGVGTGGKGAAINGATTWGVAAAANTGAGGGGDMAYANGGSGVIIVRYLT